MLFIFLLVALPLLASCNNQEFDKNRVETNAKSEESVDKASKETTAEVKKDGNEHQSVSKAEFKVTQEKKREETKVKEEKKTVVDAGNKITEQQAPKKLTVEETGNIAKSTLKGIRLTMETLAAEHEEWHLQPWITNPADNKAKYDQALFTVQNSLSQYFTKNSAEKYAPAYLQEFFWAYEGFSMADENLLDVRFRVEEQAENRFVVSSITIESEAGYYSPGTNRLEYVKEGENWKINSYQFIPSQEQPLNLTKQDIEEAFVKNGYTVIDQFQHNGTTYFIIGYENQWMSAINTLNGHLEEKIATIYSQNK